MADENVNKNGCLHFFFQFYLIFCFFNFKSQKKIITNKLLYILKVSNLIGYKSSFKSHKRLITPFIYILESDNLIDYKTQYNVILLKKKKIIRNLFIYLLT